MRVLLVGSPKKGLGFDRITRLPNIGLSSIAANLDKTLCEVKIVDLLVAGFRPYKYYLSLLKKIQPDVVGLSSMSFNYADSILLAQITKKFNQNIITVSGGYHATSDYETILKSDDMQYIDYVIRQEGEITFNKLLEALNSSKQVNDIPNLSFRNNGTIIHNPAGNLADLETLKPPDRNVRILKKGFYFFGYPADVVETSRGCVFDCDFCSINNMYGKSIRKYKIERVIEDIRDAQAHGAKALMIADDNVTLTGKHYMELCDTIIDAKLNHLKYFVQASVKGIKSTPGLAEKMVKSGARWIFLGIENESEEAMDFLVKSNQFKKSDAFEVIRELKMNGAMVLGGIIVGNPTDTRESIWANYEYVKQLKIDYPLFMALTPYPKTGTREKLIKEGLITNLDNYAKYDCFNTNIKTKHLSRDELSKLRRKIENKYPLNSGAIWRLIKEFPVFFPILILKSLIKEPKNVWGFIKDGFKKI
jgi:radical SAM superfamily enzyme YgiQ (UPF0313 family)